jgi:hypothetical protein
MNSRERVTSPLRSFRYISALAIILCAGFCVFKMTLPVYATTTYYVDAITGVGSNSNSGTTTSTPWATLAYADSQLSTNYQNVQLKYPDGSWHAVPPVWHGFLSYYPYIKGTFTGSNTNTLYDVFNGHNGTLTGASWHTGGIGLTFSGSGSYVTVPNFASFGPHIFRSIHRRPNQCRYGH